MPRDILRVAPVHLRALALRHDRAAEELAAASQAPSDAAESIRSSHGPIAAGTATALDAVLAARQAAGSGLAEASRSLRRALAGAATRYESSDDDFGSQLDREMRP